METPGEVYARRLETWRAALAAAQAGEESAANARLASFLAFLGVGGAALAWDVSWWWTLAPLAAFAATVAWHERRTRAHVRAARAVAFFERGLARVAYRFAGAGETGESLRPATHPYADHLDLFGEGSLFELLCQARTATGRATLAAWLLEPAAPDEIRARQEAVGELRPRLQLREDLAVLERKVVAALDAGALPAWGEAPPVRLPPRGIVDTFNAVTFLGLAAWTLGLAGPGFFVLAALLQGAFARVLRPRTHAVLDAVKGPAQHLAHVARLLERIEDEEAQSERLRGLRARLETGGLAPSARVARLLRHVNRLDWYANQLFAPVALFLCWGTRCALGVEGWRRRWGAALRPWVETVGEFEALLDLAAYAYEHPGDPFPEILGNGPRIEGAGLRHPLLKDAVQNDVRLDADRRLLVITGSNMSGKSTFLRTVGVNAVLAQAGAPVRADALALSTLSVAASIRTVDSLRDGASRFFAEITALRGMVALADAGRPVLFLLDEMLHGTNSHDRRVGAAGVMRGLLAKGAIGLLTTHDLALAELADELKDVENGHFESRLENGELRFDYTLRPGVVQGSNALELMRAVGLDV